jgi:hypothetical protein
MKRAIAATVRIKAAVVRARLPFMKLSSLDLHYLTLSPCRSDYNKANPFLFRFFPHSFAHDIGYWTSSSGTTLFITGNSSTSAVCVLIFAEVWQAG